MAAPMRILSVSPRLASARAGGSQRRITALLDRLAKRHEVVEVCQPRLRQLDRPPGPRERMVRSRAAAALTEVGDRTWPTAPILSGAALRLAPTGPLRELLEWADATVVEFPWQFDRCARLAPPGARLVLSAHNVEAEKFASFADAAGARVTRRPWLRYVERVERAAVRRADAVIAVSDADRRGLVARYGADPARCVVAPNGADIAALAPPGAGERDAARRSLGLGGGPVVLYAGADVTPNRRGLEWVCEAARRADGLTFLVVGRVGGRPRREGNVVFTGHVREFEPCLAAADLSVCPIEHGGGTKVKLIEALAAGLPTVAFAESLEGTGARHGEHLLVADKDAAALAQALEHLAADRALAARLGAAARAHAAEHHDWGPIAERVEALLLDLVRPAARRPLAAAAAG